MKIKNGLGNQMFQYALGRKLSEINNCDLKLDFFEFNIDDERNHENIPKNLDKFNILGTFAKKSELVRFNENRKEFNYKINLINKVFRKIWKIKEKRNYYKRDYIKDIVHGNMSVLKVKPPCYLDGDWGNYHYFDDIREKLKIELRLKKKYTNTKFVEILKEIQENPQSVGIHFRRKYLNYKSAKSVFGVMPLSYYNNGIKLICNIKKGVKLYVFADDIDWAKDNFISELPIKYIEHYPEFNDAHDFELLKSCKHNIIANSTFSWWAAYLNNNSEKIIIAPKKWYVDHRYQKHYEKGNITPPGWILI